MSNVHVLDSTGPGKYRVVYHISIPASSNSPGVPWRTILATELAKSVANGGKVSELPDGDGTNGTITSAEKAKIISGEIYEDIREEKGQSATTISGMHTKRTSEVLIDLQAKYAQYGRTI